MVIRKYAFFLTAIFCLAFCFAASAQVGQSKADSLQHILENTYADTTHVLIFNQLGLESLYTDIGRARTYFDNGLNLSMQLKYVSGEALNLKGIGITYDLQGLPEKALEYFLKAAQKYRSINNKSGLSKTLNNCGIVYKSMRNYDKALECYQESLTLKVALQDRRGIATTYNNIGEIYTLTGNHQKAFDHYQSALDIFSSLGNLRGTARVISNLGATYNILEQYPRALTNYYRALEIEEALDDKHSMAISYTSLASLYNAINKNDKAAEYVNKAIKMARLINSKNLEVSAYETASRVYEDQGNTLQALLFSRQAMQLKDSLRLLDMEQKVAEMQAKYELAQKENEIVLLNKENDLKAATIQRDTILKVFLVFMLVFIIILAGVFYIKNRQQYKANAVLKMQKHQISEAYDQIRDKNDEIKNQHDDLLKQNHYIEQQKEEIHQQANELELQRDQLSDRNRFIQQQNAELENLNRIKNKLFSIISHDLRSPLSSLSNMILLLNTNYFNDKTKLEDTVRKLSIETKSTIDLLDNLLKWSKAQMEGIRPSPEIINVHDLAAENIELYDVIARDKGIELFNDVPDMILAHADPDMIRLVIRNLVSNAIKFTSNGGKITISSQKINGTCKVNISDTGIGIDATDQQRIFNNAEHFSTRGTKNEKGTGIGLMLCREFIRKNHGDLGITSEVGKGSTFSFTLQSVN